MKFLKHARNSVLAMSAASVSAMPMAFAADDATGEKVINAVLDIILKMAFYIGVILLAWSVVMLILALKNEDADSKSRAIMLIAVSVALIGVGGFLKPVLETAGFNMT